MQCLRVNLRRFPQGHGALFAVAYRNLLQSQCDNFIHFILLYYSRRMSMTTYQEIKTDSIFRVPLSWDVEPQHPLQKNCCFVDLGSNARYVIRPFNERIPLMCSVECLSALAAYVPVLLHCVLVMVRLGDSHITVYADMHTSASTIKSVITSLCVILNII